MKWIELLLLLLLSSSSSTQAEDSQQSSADDGFIVVSGKHKKDRPANKVTNPVYVASKKSRTPMFGVRNTSTLPVIAKKVKRMSLFVSRFSPEVTAQDMEKSLQDQLKISSLTCTRLKTKFSTYASFHISVNEEDFPSINNTGVWPNGCLIAPFFGRLNPEQIYSPEAPTISANIKQPGDVSLANSSDTASGMETVSFSETSVSAYESTRRHNPEQHRLLHLRENLKYHRERERKPYELCLTPKLEGHLCRLPALFNKPVTLQVCCLVMDLHLCEVPTALDSFSQKSVKTGPQSFSPSPCW
jgi:hypothetical protein